MNHKISCCIGVWQERAIELGVVMKLRGVKRIAVSVTASAAMVGGLALAAPASASAAPASPTQAVAQDGNSVTVTLTPPGGLAPCGTAAIELGRAVEVLADPIKIIRGGQGITGITATLPFGAAATGTRTLPDGVYVVASACALLDVSDPVVQPIIVPTGIGSLTSAVNFGSTVIENPEAIGNLLALFDLFG